MTDVEPYALIHLTKIRKKVIVPVKCVKKLKYEKYIQDKDSYKQLQMTYKDPETGEKSSCAVLYVGASETDVQDYADNPPKRTRIPKFNSSAVIDSTMEETMEEEEIYDTGTDKRSIEKSKKLRKNIKKQQVEVAKNRDNAVAQKYLDSLSQESNESESMHEINNLSPLASSSLLSSSMVQTTHSLENAELKTVIKAYKNQITFFKNKCENAEKEIENLRVKNQKLKEMMESKGPHFTAVNGSSPYVRFSGSAVNQENLNNFTDDDEINLGRGVKCKSLSLKDAYKAKSNGSFFTKLYLGIYGVEELAKRCVKKRKNTVGQILLSPKKKEVVEDEFHKYLSEYRKLPDHYVRSEMEKCNTYHHNAISGARSMLEKQRQVEESIKAFEEQQKDHSNCGSTAVGKGSGNSHQNVNGSCTESDAD